ncbi:hypothetical protein [Leptolyngbya sp. FACHB-711]|uniref:hypothetical protein n=1 Tax=Leptolyngbya sp. FACHB-711 TaxID=2692813 RepID=UPI001689EACB|nr:hypothetical protein [Leptolyngbya sp. FACHB-711]MBD2028301.1 hypothetical protein [Leptolyngbya sp. FACHB-711]
MTNKALSTYFELHRRYYRSVNLERDLDKPDAVQGYVPTERSAEALRRILSAIGDSNAHRAWTLTGVYGTGKSAFAHYLAALCAPEESPVADEAWAIAKYAFPADSLEMKAVTNVPEPGLLRAVATAQREPLSWTIVRALSRGFELFWKKKRKPDFWMDLNEWRFQTEEGNCQITDQQVLKLIREIVQTVETDVLLIIDELGKNLEYAAHHQGIQDLYLLQQIAELELKGDYQVHLLGILHQSFAGYSDRLSTIEQSEWTKIHGRFTDIVLTESPSQMTRLIGQAIDRSNADPVLHSIHLQAESWFDALKDVLSEYEISAKVLADAYPLHPLTALVLPMLCVRYAQNDRSLFTFLTSDEPYAFSQFLKSTAVQGDQIPTLKLYQLYDYFVEAVTGLASRLNLQRWVEVQGLIQDAKDQSQDVLKVLKTIGVLNLVTSTGKFRATPELVALALCDSPTDEKGRKHWQKTIQHLKQKKLITHRSRTQDELRIWQGSDFDVEAAIQVQIEQAYNPLADLLNTTYPLKPLVAQRHYTTTGNLRYFEQRYVDSRVDLKELTCATAGGDGLIAYWLDTAFLESVPPQTVDGKPLIVITVANLELLRMRSEDFLALKKIWKDAPELQTDGVAKREVRQRLVEAEQLLNETVALAFNWSAQENTCWIDGKLAVIESSRGFQSALSNLCDRIYDKGAVLDNELINRRELTSQGAKARRELIEAMLKNAAKERLGLEGYGPEVAMYGSVLEATGIHCQEDDEWGFHPPLPCIPADSLKEPLRNDLGSENPLESARVDVSSVWDEIERFCLEAKDSQQTLDLLYQKLEQPPFGVKLGVIPILLAAFLLVHVDDVGIYKDGTFIPVLGPEHFELLVKEPSRFSVKYFEMAGLRSQVFKELETVLKSPNAKAPAGVRNASLLAVAKPLFGFVRQLPEFTRSTKRLSSEARKVLQALQTAQEPDALLFVSLPDACGFTPMTTGSEENEQEAKAFRKKLVQCIHEIQTAYDNLLADCQKHLYEAFGIRSKEANLREDLRVRASYLVGQCIDPVLRHFVAKAVEEDLSDRDWLEALVRIVADKHPKGWIDEDFSRFELALSDLVRRFENLEALRTEIRRQGKGFDALRITVTEPNGQEVHEVVWIDEEYEELFDRLTEEVLNTPALKDNPRLQKGFLAKLNEKLLSRKDIDSQGEFGKPTRKRGQSA